MIECKMIKAKISKQIMKHHFFLLIIILLGSQYISAQDTEKKENFSFEMMISGNRTTATTGEDHGKFGFGAGVYSAFFTQKRCNLIVGIEYNRNNLFIESLATGGLWWSEERYNTTYSMNNIGVPVCIRINMGKKVIFFVEAGAFFDLAIWGKGEGIFKSVKQYPDDGTVTMIEKPFAEKVSYRIPNIGLQGGVGLRIPIIQKWEILLKGDYKWGIRNLVDPYYGTLYNRYWRFSAGFRMNF
ncbi:PorT family protein [Bacteroidales bacterium OttesenSCG-928-L19]|nr:PorT family protein [Bacteroidales bacterium OttesenSCG-928-L19]